MKRKINATIIAGSKNEHGQTITTWVLTYPRMIHAEMMTHRVFSRNAASSRAIPANVLRNLVADDPFIPVAFQQEHKGMQGTEYLEGSELAEAKDHWLTQSLVACRASERMSNTGVTKQLTNRLLEPFQWYTAIFTTTETENFFNLRCPQYNFEGKTFSREFKSRKDATTFGLVANDEADEGGSILEWLKHNKGQGEIHISLLAEAMWDSMNEYDYKQLKAGEWHIPFGDKINRFRLSKDLDRLGLDDDLNEASIKIATARCARVSYNNFEGKDDYEADIKLIITY